MIHIKGNTFVPWQSSDPTKASKAHIARVRHVAWPRPRGQQTVVEALMKCFAPLPIGTRVIAEKDFGPIIKGQFGIVTGLVRRGLWRSPAYACTFLGGIKVTALGRHMTRHDHGCSCQMLEDPFWFLQTRRTAGVAGQCQAEVRRPPN